MKFSIVRPRLIYVVDKLLWFLLKGVDNMDFVRELSRELTWEEYRPIMYCVEEATELYSRKMYDEAKELILEAITICVQKCQNGAAEKVRYYLRFFRYGFTV